MTAAGINPALAYSQGGASSPAGAQATQDDVISPSVSSAMQAKRLKADLALLTEQKAKTEAEKKGQFLANDMARLNLESLGWDYPAPIKVGGKTKLLQPTRSARLLTAQREADIAFRLAQARREGVTSDTMQPVADIAKRFGILAPILAAGANAIPGLLKGIGALGGLRKKTINVLKLSKGGK